VLSDLQIVTGSAAIIVITVVAVEALSLFIRGAAKIAGVGRTVIRDIRDGMRVIALVIIISGILSFTGLASEFTALTISGIAGLALSLALQTTLSNIISGILMINDGVIRIGDRIEYSGIKGVVVRVALRNCWIKQDDGSLAVVSNSSLSGGPLVNRTAEERLKKKYAID
jgi:small conductance mechanosensitive channel